MVVSSEVFGQTESGEDVWRYTIKNKHGLELEVISFGATFVALRCPDRNGKMDDVVMGYDKLEDYLSNPHYLGSTVGRVANRIANAKFSLDDKEYKLAVNNPPNTLHGGWVGFNKYNWKSEVKGENKVKFVHQSPDGDENFPGDVTVRLTFSFTDHNEVKLNYKATAKAPTIVNLTNHGYFNLAGQVDHDVLDHIAQIHAKHYLPLNDVQIPTGEECSVSSPNDTFDFTKPKPIGKDIHKIDGYDHNYCVKGKKECCAEVYHPSSGRVLKMFTDQPGVQFYTANGFDGVVGKGGVLYHKFGAFCLEAQNYPDAVNQTNFPSPVLRPGETYKQKTVYKIDVKE